MDAIFAWQTEHSMMDADPGAVELATTEQLELQSLKCRDGCEGFAFSSLKFLSASARTSVGNGS